MTHADFEHSAVTDEARCGFLPMLAVMLGFTFFSASMVVGVAMFAVPTTMFLMDVSALQGSWWLAGGTLELAGTPPLPLRCVVPIAALCGFGYLGWTLPGSGIPALDGMAVSAFVYCLLRRFDACKKVIGRPLCLSAGNGIILLFPKRQRPLLA